MEQNCGVCGNACTYFRCKCSTHLCEDCFARITKDSISPRCPHCHLVIVFSNSGQSNSSTATRKLSRSDLYKMRVVQGNLVYVQGISAAMACEQVIFTQVLCHEDYFGHFGKINKCVISRSTSLDICNYGAYITFSSEEEASLCIKVCATIGM